MKFHEIAPLSPFPVVRRAAVELVRLGPLGGNAHALLLCFRLTGKVQSIDSFAELILCVNRRPTPAVLRRMQLLDSRVRAELALPLLDMRRLDIARLGAAALES
jgi:hypothetical protein